MRVSSGVILALGGVALIYLGYTGYWKSAWIGIQGKASTPGNLTPANGETQSQTGGQGDSITGQIGSNPGLLAEFPKGGYYVAPTGQLMVGNEGVG